MKCGSMNRSCRLVPQRVKRPLGGILPEPGDERADQHLLGQAHARLRRHLEAAELDQAKPPGGTVGRIELVDADLGPVGVAGHIGQQVAQQPVDSQGGGGFAFARSRDLLQRDLQLVETIVTRLVDARRLAGRADEKAGKQVRQRSGAAASAG
jgi:hypothetical protein